MLIYHFIIFFLREIPRIDLYILTLCLATEEEKKNKVLGFHALRQRNICVDLVFFCQTKSKKQDLSSTIQIQVCLGNKRSVQCVDWVTVLMTNTGSKGTAPMVSGRQLTLSSPSALRWYLQLLHEWSFGRRHYHSWSLPHPCHWRELAAEV